MTTWHCDVTTGIASSLFMLINNGPFPRIYLRQKTEGLDLRAIDPESHFMFFAHFASDGSQSYDEGWYYFSIDDFKVTHDNLKPSPRRSKKGKNVETFDIVVDDGKKYLRYISAKREPFLIALQEPDLPDHPGKFDDDILEKIKALYRERSQKSRPIYLLPSDTNIIEIMDFAEFFKVFNTCTLIGEQISLECDLNFLECYIANETVSSKLRIKIKTNAGKSIVIIPTSFITIAAEYFATMKEQFTFYISTDSPVIMEDHQGITWFMIAPRITKDEKEGESE